MDSGDQDSYLVWNCHIVYLVSLGFCLVIAPVLLCSGNKTTQ